jgi:hypothetical protein
MCVHGLVVRQRSGTPKVRKLYNYPSPGFGAKFIIHNSNLQTALRGVMERVFLVEKEGQFVTPPKGNEEIFFTRLRKFKRKLIARCSKVEPLTYNSFVDLYCGKRKLIYRDAVVSLLKEPLQANDAKIKAFIKCEKIKVTENKLDPRGKVLSKGKSDPAPRLIHPRSPRFNAEIGIYMRPLEKEIYRGISRLYDGKPVVAKGMNSVEVGKLLETKWRKYIKPVSISLDASRFDQHVRAFALRWSHLIYVALVSTGAKQLRKLLNQTITNKVNLYTLDGVIKYTTDGCRMSGDMDTALGNCLIMCAMIYAFCDDYNIPHDLIDNGDDANVICEAEHADKFKNLPGYFLDFGFTMKVGEPIYVLENVEFCKTQPVYDGTGYRVVRQFPDCVDKDFHSFLPITNSRAFQHWMYDMGNCGLALNAGIPVLQSLYQACLRSAGNSTGFHLDVSRKSGAEYLANGLISVAREITQAARYSFYLAFQVTPDEQIALEDHYNSSFFKYSSTALECGPFGHITSQNLII